MSLLARSLAVEELAPGRYRARAAPDYQGMSGLFGGWSAALLLSALLQQPGGARAERAAGAPVGDEGGPGAGTGAEAETDAAGSPSALTTHYFAPVLPGRALEIRTERLRAGRSLSFWQATLGPADADETWVQATLVRANRRESDHFDQLVCPSAPDPADLERFVIGGQPFGQRMEIRPASANPPFGLGDSRSLSWIRENSGRPIDAVSLAFLADVGAPRIFYYSAGPRPMSTITLSTYFYATPEELAAVGDDYLLSELTGTRGAYSTFGSRGQLWSRQGALLATMEQLCWFK